MKCPFCGKSNTRVVDSRDLAAGSSIRRRRECRVCRKRFTTYERPENSVTFVIKRDGRMEPFDKQKIRESISIACNKRNVSEAKIDRIVRKITRQVKRTYGPEVPSRFIGELILKELKHVDSVAYVRFASVYKQFADVTQFIEEASRVRKR